MTAPPRDEPTDQAAMTIAPVLNAAHPRRAGFRDGLIAAGVLLGLALAAGVLALPAGAPREPRPNGSGEPLGIGAGSRSDGPDVGVAGGDVPGGSAPAGDRPTLPITTSPPDIDPLTLVYLPTAAIGSGTDMTPGCAFLFDLGPGSNGPITRFCPGRDGPTGPLGTLDADPGAVLYVENSEFTPSIRPSQPAVACGHVSGRPPVFAEDPTCLIAYATSTNGEFAFRLPADRGRWVVAVRGCETRLVAACGAWYAEIDTIDAPPAP